jgi:hypothetical protein
LSDSAVDEEHRYNGNHGRPSEDLDEVLAALDAQHLALAEANAGGWWNQN